MSRGVFGAGRATLIRFVRLFCAFVRLVVVRLWLNFINFVIQDFDLHAINVINAVETYQSDTALGFNL